MGGQIASTAIGTLGKVLGGFIGGPIGSMIGGMAGGIIGSLLFSRKAKPLVPDVQIMNSSYGRPIPIVWGTMRLPATMIWQTDITTHEHSVGKGASGTTYTYTQSAALAFCEGPVQYQKLFLDGKLFFDATSLFPEELTKYKFAIRPYAGDDSQLPDAAMQYWVATHVIPGDSCPAYRGLAYMVFDQPELNHFGNRFPQTTCILSTTITNTTKFVKFTHYTPTGGSFWNHQFSYHAPDWVRGVIYAIYAPNDWRIGDASTGNWGIMVLSLYTQSEVMAADYNKMFFDGGLLPTAFGGHIPEPQGITSAEGGMVYVLCFVYGHDYILTFSPNTLIFTGDYMLCEPPNGAGSLFGASSIVGFALTSATGVSYLIAGIYGYLGVFIANPLLGTISNAYPVEYHGFAGAGLGGHAFRLGARDDIAGTQDIWILNNGALDPNQRIFVYKVKIVGSDPSSFGVDAAGPTRIFTAYDFGLGRAQFYPGSTNPGAAGFQTAYDHGDDGIVIDVFQNFMLKYSSLYGVRWTQQGALSYPSAYSDTSLGILPSTGGGRLDGNPTLPYPELRAFADLNMSTGQWTTSPVPHTDPPGFPAYPFTEIHSSSYGNMVIYESYADGELWIAYLMRQTNNKAKVADIIRDICHRVGMTDDMLDLGLVTQETDGYCIQEMKSAGAAIADLLHVYQIDMVESDYTLRFVPRGQASVVTIPEADLASLDQNDPSQFWRVKEAQQQEMPMILVVRFQDPGLDFQTGASYAKRTEIPISTVWSKRRMSIDLPVIANNQEATEICTKWLWTMWAERDTVETVLPWKYLYLDPADSITVAMDNGDNFEVRIEDQSIGADFAIHTKAAFEDATVYSPSPTLKGASYGFIPQTVKQAPFADFLQFNVPLLQDEDDTGGVSTRIYYAVGAMSGGWVSGEIFRSTDNSATWQDYINIPFAANWGQAISQLSDTPSKFATDYANTVTVQMTLGGQFPQSCTYDEMLSGANGALLGQEVIQYQTAVINANGTVTLSNILRGRRGTEWATGLHSTGEHFIMLQPGKIGGNTLSLAEINAQELWKLVPSGRFLDQTPADAFTYRGFDLMPYAPVRLKRAIGAGGLVLSWTRRTRLGGILLDGIDTAPLYEASELYNAYILPGPAAITLFNPMNPASYTRSYLSLTTPTCTYASGEMTTDSFYPATDTLYLAVYQVSSVVGMGFQGYAALPAF